MTDEDLEQELRLAASMTDITASVESVQLRNDLDPVNHPLPGDLQHDRDSGEADPSDESVGGNVDRNLAVGIGKDVTGKLNEGSNDGGNKGKPLIRQDNVD